MNTFDYDEFRRGMMAARGGTSGDRMLLGRTMAALEVLGHTGVSEVEIAYEEDPTRWWVGGNWNGTRAFSEKFPYPAHAAEDLLDRVLNGGLCKRCGRTTVVGVFIDGPFCIFTLTADDPDEFDGYRYVRTCEVEKETKWTEGGQDASATG